MKFEILMDKKENPRKCTIHPLRDRDDFAIRYFSKNRPISRFQSDCLLHIDGEDLSKVAHGSLTSLALIDCTWKKVSGCLMRIERPLPRLVSIPPGFSTAYPRKNMEGKDPDGGLATIEALFIAAAFLGHWDETLLDKYHFKAEFLAQNREAWEKYKLGPLAASKAL